MAKKKKKLKHKMMAAYLATPPRVIRLDLFQPLGQVIERVRSRHIVHCYHHVHHTITESETKARGGERDKNKRHEIRVGRRQAKLL